MTGRPDVRIVSRHIWRARPPKSRHYIKTPTPELWWHHFASEHHGHQGMRDIQAFHMDKRGWSDIAYSFCVDEDGTIYEGRGVGIAGGHTANRNSISHAICLMGNFQTKPVPRAALQSCAALAAHGIESGWWKGWTSGHRNAPGASTACPGDYAMRALPDLRALTDLYVNKPAAQEDDMTPREFIKTQFGAWLGRLPVSDDELDAHLYFLHINGREKALDNIANSTEAQARRKS